MQTYGSSIMVFFFWQSAGFFCVLDWRPIQLDVDRGRETAEVRAASSYVKCVSLAVHESWLER